MQPKQFTKPGSLSTIWEIERRGLCWVAKIAEQIYFVRNLVTQQLRLDDGDWLRPSLGPAGHTSSKAPGFLSGLPRGSRDGPVRPPARKPDKGIRGENCRWQFARPGLLQESRTRQCSDASCACNSELAGSPKVTRIPFEPRVHFSYNHSRYWGLAKW